MACVPFVTKFVFLLTCVLIFKEHIIRKAQLFNGCSCSFNNFLGDCKFLFCCAALNLLVCLYSVSDMLRWAILASSTLCNIGQTCAPNFCASKRLVGTISSSIKTMNNPKRMGEPLKGRFQAITLTDSALARVKELLSQRPDAIGLRIGVRTRGCNGLSYTLSFCSEQQKGDEIVVQDGLKIFIDRRAQLTLLGSEMHYQKTLISSEFVFNNPNIKGTCGCGESFSI